MRPNYDTPVMDNPVNQPEVLTRREEILEAAKSWLGKDASPANKATNDHSCSESVSNVLNGVLTFPSVLSTAELDHFLDRSGDFVPTKIPKPGTIIVSPRTNTVLGHCGIFLTADRIASNTSADGIWRDNYDLKSWVAEMRGVRGLHVFMYDAV